MSFMAELAFGKAFERVAAEKYAAQTWPGSVIAPCPTYADVDFVAISPLTGLLGFIEVKTRRIPSTKYDSTIVSLRKHHTGRYAKEFLKVPTPCVVIFTDTLGVFDLRLVPDTIAPIGRWDRPGKEVDHAHYLHSRLVWMPELHAEILKKVAEEQGLEVEA